MNKDGFIYRRFLEEFQGFMRQLHRLGMETNLEGELDAHLDYQKH